MIKFFFKTQDQKKKNESKPKKEPLSEKQNATEKSEDNFLKECIVKPFTTNAFLVFGTKVGKYVWKAIKHGVLGY